MKLKFWLMLIPVILLAGCSRSSTKPATGSLVTEFRLTDAAGNTTETFSLGEDIFFEFTIVNETGEEQEWTISSSIPAVDFFVSGVNIIFGSTSEQRDAATVVIYGVLPAGEELLTVSGWFDHSWHAPLAVGSYTANAILNAEFEGFELSGPWTLDFEIVPPRERTTEIFALYRMPAFGFCLAPNEVYYASIINRDGTYILSGTIAQDMSMLTMPCAFMDWTDPCFHQLPFGEVYLSSVEAEQLERLLTAFPQEEHQPDHACDPCMTSRYHINGRIEVINPCASGSEQYWQAVEDIENFLTGFVPQL